MQVVDLGANKLQSIPTNALRHLATVRILIMRNNAIRSIGAADLSALVDVAELDFENCRLRYVDPGAFRHLKRLVELNLADNELVTLDPATEHQLPSSLTIFRLTGNPWLCDCRLRWLRRWLSMTAFNWDLAAGGVPTCALPKHRMHGVSWRHVEPGEFACTAYIRSIESIYRYDNYDELEDAGDGEHSNDSYVNLTSSTLSKRLLVAAVRCIATGDPLPIVTWSVSGVSTARTMVERRTTFDREPAIESVLPVADEHFEADRNDVDDAVDDVNFRCIADNAAGRDEASHRVTLSSRQFKIFSKVPMTSSSSAADVERDAQTTIAPRRPTISPDLLFCGSIIGTVVLMTSLVLCTVCMSATRTTARDSNPSTGTTGTTRTDGKPTSADRSGRPSHCVLRPVVTASETETDSRELESPIGSPIAEIGHWRRVETSVAVVRSKSIGTASCGTMRRGMSSFTSLKQFDTRSVRSASGSCFGEFETELPDEATSTAAFRFKVFRPNKPWSSSDCDGTLSSYVRLGPSDRRRPVPPTSLVGQRRATNGPMRKLVHCQSIDGDEAAGPWRRRPPTGVLHLVHGGWMVVDREVLQRIEPSMTLYAAFYCHRI